MSLNIKLIHLRFVPESFTCWFKSMANGFGHVGSIDDSCHSSPPCHNTSCTSRLVFLRNLRASIIDQQLLLKLQWFVWAQFSHQYINSLSANSTCLRLLKYTYSVNQKVGTYGNLEGLLLMLQEQLWPKKQWRSSFCRAQWSIDAFLYCACLFNRIIL